MIKNIKNIRKIEITILIVALIISGGVLCKPTFATDNALKSRYGFYYLNTSPQTRPISDKEREEFLKEHPEDKDRMIVHTEDDNKLKTVIKKWADSIGRNSEELICNVPYCTNKEHFHASKNIKSFIKGIDNDDRATKNKAYENSFDKKDLYTGTWTYTHTRISSDFDGLTSKAMFINNLKDHQYSINNYSMRVNFSYTNGNVNFILKDGSGIANNGAHIKIIDQNTNKTIKEVNDGELAKQLKNTTKNSLGQIVKGVYSVPLSKLTIKNGMYFVKIETKEGSGLEGYDMAKFYPDLSQRNDKMKKAPSKVTFNGSVRINTDKTKKGQIKLNFKDYAGVKRINVTAYKSNKQKIKDYSIVGNEIKSDKQLAKYIKFAKYDSKTDIASLAFGKSYFENHSYKKDNDIIFQVKTTDKSKAALTGTGIVRVKYEKGKWNVNMGARAGIEYNKGILSLKMKDYNGIAEGKAALKIIDQNNGDAVVADLRAPVLNSGLKNVEKQSNRIVKGDLNINIGHLKADKDNNYKIRVKSTDRLGYYNIENIVIKAAK